MIIWSSFLSANNIFEHEKSDCIIHVHTFKKVLIDTVFKAFYLMHERRINGVTIIAAAAAALCHCVECRSVCICVLSREQCRVERTFDAAAAAAAMLKLYLC